MQKSIVAVVSLIVSLKTIENLEEDVVLIVSNGNH